MSDQKLRCALVYRLDAGSTVVLAKYDHAAQYETHGGGGSGDLYGGRDKSYSDAVAAVIENDPPSGLAEAGTIGGFKVVQSDQHQVVYGADADRICKQLRRLLRMRVLGEIWLCNCVENVRNCFSHLRSPYFVAV
jgi:hypothetical protein